MKLNFRDLVKEEYIDLGGNDLNDSDMEVLAKVLNDGSCRVKRLLLNNNNNITLVDGRLAGALEHNKTLQVLNLYNNCIANEGAKRLAKALKSNKTLKQLHLGANHIRNGGAEKLASTLGKHKSLRIVWLNENKIGDIGLKKLVNAFAQNATLEKLHLEANDISPVAKGFLLAIEKTAAKKDVIIAQKDAEISSLKGLLACKDEEIATLKSAYPATVSMSTRDSDDRATKRLRKSGDT